MIPEDRDRELSRLFEAERLADESGAPPLDTFLGRSRPRRARAADALQRLALAAAVALVIATAAVVLRSGTPAAGPGEPETTQIAEWRSPTAFLLDTPGSELLTDVPTLTLSNRPLVSAEPGEAAAPQPTKGVAQ